MAFPQQLTSYTTRRLATGSASRQAVPGSVGGAGRLLTAGASSAARDAGLLCRSSTNRGSLSLGGGGGGRVTTSASLPAGCAGTLSYWYRVCSVGPQWEGLGVVSVASWDLVRHSVGRAV